MVIKQIQMLKIKSNEFVFDGFIGLASENGGCLCYVFKRLSKAWPVNIIRRQKCLGFCASISAGKRSQIP